MRKFLTVVLLTLGLVVALAAPSIAVAQEDAIMTDYDYSRLTFGNGFANQTAKPIILKADRAIHAPVSTLALLSAIEYGARYQGMVANVDTGMYFYDATDCPGGSTSPAAVPPDDTVGCWYLMSASADIWVTLADTTPTSGAMLIGIKDTATYYTGTTVETALAEVGAEFLTKQDLAVPTAIGNIATLDATGQVVDSGDLLSEYALLVSAPTNGNLVCTDALGQPYDCASAPGDYQTFAIPTAAGNVCTLSALGAVEDSTIASSNLQVLTVPAVADSLAGLTALGAVYDTTILAADMADAVTVGIVYGDNMRNSTDTAQSLADTTEEVIDLEDVELAGDVTYAAGTTSLATIPVGGTGTYAIVYGATFAAGAGTYNRLVINVNGVTRTTDEETPDNANPIEVVGNTMLRLAAGDTVGLYATQDSGGALDVTAAYMAIQRMQ